jgi:hypothetical protein
MWNLVVPLAVELVKAYVKSSSSTKDDKVLEIVQTGADYLAKKPNNNVSTEIIEPLKKCTMKKLQG